LISSTSSSTSPTKKELFYFKYKSVDDSMSSHFDFGNQLGYDFKDHLIDSIKLNPSIDAFKL